MKESLLHFVETSVFTKQIDKLASLETLLELQNDLVKDPTKGNVIAGTNGARKARIGDKEKNRGKRGAFRYIYVYLDKASIIYLLVFYGKNEKDDLSKDEQKQIAALVEILKKKYKGK